MNDAQKRRIEFGDFQTSDDLALKICARLQAGGVKPTTIIEPTCGIGAFVIAAEKVFKEAKSILAFEINGEYLELLSSRLSSLPRTSQIVLEQADFFSSDWQSKLSKLEEPILVIGNFPWVTNAGIGSIGGSNLPEKSNFLGHGGFDAISGKANFDISEWMLLEVLRWFRHKSGTIAMLVKTAVARKVLAHAEKQRESVVGSFIVKIDAKKEFSASVDACLLVIELSSHVTKHTYDYKIYEGLSDVVGHRVGHRMGLTIGDLDGFERNSSLIGDSPQKWRSGVKHDAAKVMEFTKTEAGFENGFGEIVELETDYLYPLLKGSDVGSGKKWRNKYVLVTQRNVGEPTTEIQLIAPKTWRYLEKHAEVLDKRGSKIYEKNPRFSIFGVGDYAFRPWRIAICGLYKNLNFRLIAPIDGRPVMFDDTVYYVSFASEADANDALSKLQSARATELLSSLIFWDEKRPIKASILNVFDWSKINSVQAIDADNEVEAHA